MKRCILIPLLLIISQLSLSAQSEGGYHFGLKGGLTLANQTWNDSERRMLLTNHFNFFVETRDLDDKGSLFAQLGLHTRGSSIRFSILNGGFSDDGYKFKNISLMAGAKRKIASSLSASPYYFVGIRAEYTVSENLLEIFERYTSPSFPTTYIYPDPFFVNKFNYGISIGGGFEFQGGEFFNPAIEITLSPDLSFQYDEPPLNNILTSSGQTINTGGRRIRNVSLEVSLILRMLREVVYED